MIAVEDEELTGDRGIGHRGREREELSARTLVGRKVQAVDRERAGEAQKPTEEHEGPARRRRPSEPSHSALFYRSPPFFLLLSYSRNTRFRMP